MSCTSIVGQNSSVIIFCHTKSLGGEQELINGIDGIRLDVVQRT